MNESYKSYMTKLSQNWLEVLVPFSYEYNKKFSGVEISRMTKIPQKTVSRYLRRLVLDNVLRVDSRGSSNFYYIDLSDERAGIIFNFIEAYKSFVFSGNSKLWKELRGVVPFGDFVLFGSRVKGYSTSSSDIDLVIFSKSTEKLKSVLRGMPKVQAHVVSFEKFERLVLGKDTLALEVLKAHVVFGDTQRFVDLCRRFYG